MSEVEDAEYGDWETLVFTDSKHHQMEVIIYPLVATAIHSFAPILLVAPIHYPS
jgi:hypothetical protein